MPAARLVSTALAAALGIALLAAPAALSTRAEAPRDDSAWPELAPWLAGVHSWDPDVEAVAGFLTPGRTGLAAPDGWDLARLVVAEARRAGIDPGLALAVIRVESSGRPTAVSHAGAVGLMQLLPETAAAEAERLGLPWTGPESLHDPYLNVRVGIHYLARLIDRFGDLETALAAYNAGPTRIARFLRRRAELPEGYARRVLSRVDPGARV